MGDTFSNISNSTIINRSAIQGAVNTLQDRHQTDSAEALRSVSEAVEESGNREAGEFLDGFVEELDKPEPRKSILKSMWSGVQAILPNVPKMIEAAEGIGKLIQG